MAPDAEPLGVTRLMEVLPLQIAPEANTLLYTVLYSLAGGTFEGGRGSDRDEPFSLLETEDVNGSRG